MIDWTHWHNEPFLIGGLIFLGWLYAMRGAYGFTNRNNPRILIRSRRRTAPAGPAEQ